MQGQQKTPEFLAINRFGKVPALEDDGFQLAESNAISRYIACKQNCDLYPQNAQKRAEIDQWMDFSSLHVRANAGKILFNKLVAPMQNMPVNEQAIAEGQEFLNASLATVENALEGHAYLTGETETIADIAMTAALDSMEKIEFDLSPYPNVQKWRNNSMSKSWYTDVHSHFGAEIE